MLPKIRKKLLKEALDLLKKPVFDGSSYLNYSSFVADLKLSAEKDCPSDPLTANEFDRLTYECSYDKFIK